MIEQASSRAEDSGDIDYGVGARLVPPITRMSATIDLVNVILILVITYYFLGPAIYRLDMLRGFSGLHAWLVVSAFNGAVILAMIAILLHWRGLRWRSIGIFPQHIGRQILWSVLAAVVANLAALTTSLLVSLFQESAPILKWRQEEAYSQAAELGSTSQGAAIVALFVVSSCWEELVFRGLILTRLRRITSRWWRAALICSVAFAIMHLENGMKYAIGAFILSLTLSFVYVRSGSLVTVALAHILYNCSHVFLVRMIADWRA